MHPRNFGSEKIAPTDYLRPPLHVSRSDILHFKYTRVSAVNRIATRTFRDKKTTTTKPILSFDLILKSTLARIKEKKLEPEINKTKETNFVWRIPWKFYSGWKKMRNASGHQCKKKRRRKKVNRTTYKIFSIKRVTRKFLEVLRCRLAKQRERNVQKKCAAGAKLLLLFFFCCFRCRSRLVSMTRFCICFSKL